MPPLGLILQQAKGGVNEFVLRLETAGCQLLAEKLFQMGSKRYANIHGHRVALASTIVKLPDSNAAIIGGDVLRMARSGYGLGKPPPGTTVPINQNRDASSVADDASA
jgi:hypothetical protein